MRFNGWLGAKLVDLCNYCSEYTLESEYSITEIISIPLVKLTKVLLEIIFFSSALWGWFVGLAFFEQLMTPVNVFSYNSKPIVITSMLFVLVFVITGISTWFWLDKAYTWLNKHIIIYKAPNYNKKVKK